MSFNGAAPARARSWQGGVFARAAGPRCFNGAAPARARSLMPLVETCAESTGLQWGRARAGAELTVQTRGIKETRELQWGRARAGAELSRIMLPSTARLSLQWGRARA